VYIKLIYHNLAEKALNIESVKDKEPRERQDTVVDIATRLPNRRRRYRGTIPSRDPRLLSLQNFQTGLGSLSPGVKLPGCEADHSRTTPGKKISVATVPLSMHLHDT
jgi:hypothetical protein